MELEPSTEAWATASSLTHEKISSFLVQLLSITSSSSASASCATGIVVVQVTPVSVAHECSAMPCPEDSTSQHHPSHILLSSALPSTVFAEPEDRD